MKLLGTILLSLAVFVSVAECLTTKEACEELANHYCRITETIVGEPTECFGMDLDKKSDGIGFWACKEEAGVYSFSASIPGKTAGRWNFICRDIKGTMTTKENMDIKEKGVCARS